MSNLPPASGMGQIQVERAIAEVRAGRPLLIRAGRSRIVAICVEALTPDLADWLQPLARHRSRLVLPAPRLRRLGLDRQTHGAIALPRLDLGRIETLALQVGARFDAPVAALTRLDAAALELARIALVLPAMVVANVAGPAVAQTGMLEVEAASIEQFRAANVASLKIVSRAPVPLEGAPDTEFVVYRGGEGLRDQVAVVVGKPDLNDTVTVRLHSACLTGDLFGSLKCDCGDQLRHTAKFMAENGGGVLLYLDQEGRGNGLSNKIRAYKLQTQGYDTYDADEVLGFDHDQRGFDFAAEMLKLLGIKRVRVMTNNPYKIAALETAGLEVDSHQRILGRKTDQNVMYLAAKRDRAGHMIDMDVASQKGSAKE
jgi:GTP cyclohydrolase II